MLAIGIHLALLLALPPLLLGIINRTKAVVAGRTGTPLLQAYFDISKLLKKGAVYSTSSSFIFKAGPSVGLTSVLVAGALVPLCFVQSPFGFSGDIVVFAYVLGLGRFFTMAAALDTGSSFEGMGASREAAIAVLAEPALFLALAVLCVSTHSVSLSKALAPGALGPLGADQTGRLAAAIALFIVMLAECSRIPVDDPNTHLELTMVHEVMVLDHGGPDLAFILYGGAVRLFVMGSLIVHGVLPAPWLHGGAGIIVFTAAAILLSVLVGLVESTTARLRLIRVPQFLMAASVIASLGLATILFRGAP